MIPPIATRTVDLAHDVFADNLLTAFVGGSYARGTQTPTSDVDTVVILDHSDRDQETRFAEGFRTLHLDGGLKLDHCGEVFDLSTLDGLLTFTQTCLEAVPAIQASACYVGDCPLSIFRKGDVVWKMLEEPKVCVHDPGELLRGLEARAVEYFRRWPMPRVQPYKAELTLPPGTRQTELAVTWAARAGTAAWTDTPMGVGLERWFGADLPYRAQIYQGAASLREPVGDPWECPLPVADVNLVAALSAQCLSYPFTIESEQR